ncbi:MAG: biotin/lipoyl-binding protein, partial [Bryobacteraceae bacterium]
MFSKKRLLTLGAVVAAMAAGTVAWFHYRPAHPRPVLPASSQGKRPLPPEVTLTGRIRARNIVAVPAPVEGILERFMVQPGQEVFEGQLLARIHNQGLETARQTAQADFERVENRVRALESALVAAR